MKLFQRLLVAPAALGLMAPVAATAAELNINDVSSYSDNGVATQSVSNFSDVHPTDWAYQALNDMRQRHGCTVVSPNGSMTRYEAAALLNKCLENVAVANEEEQALIDEFGAELAVIRGRIDVLEDQVTGYEAGVFSTTTKLTGVTTFVVGGRGTDSSTTNGDDGSENESVTFNYDTKLSLESSFSSDDLLVNRIRVGNFQADQPFGPDGDGTPITNYDAGDSLLEVASATGNGLEIDRSYYKFPVGNNVTTTIGARVRQDDMLGVWPSAYPTDAILDVLAGAGANASYNLALGAGAGLTWEHDNWVASALFVSQDADNAYSDEIENKTSRGGLLTDTGRDDATAQIAYVGEKFTIAGVVTRSDDGNWNDSVDADDRTAYGLSGFYSTDFESPYLPATISAGYGWENPENETIPDSSADEVEEKQTWTIGMTWADAFIEGNNLGFAIGTAEAHREDDGYSDPLAYEVYYQMVVSDNVTVTPAIFNIQRDGNDNNDLLGALVKTTFKF